MIYLIAKKDLLLNLISARFVIGFLLCLTIIPFTIVISIDNYLNQKQVYKVEQAQAEKEFKEVRVWSMLRPTVVKEPAVLSIFSNGISDNTGNKTKINMNVYPLFPTGHVNTRDNPLLNAFFTIDFAKVIAILISLIALVFSYDAITREREDGTMKLSFTGKVSRITFLFGKITGLLLTLLPIVLFCYVLACLIILINPEISISATDWGGIFLLFLTSIVYMLVFVLIGMLISSLVSRSSSAIILSLLCWIWFLFLLPNISTYLSQTIIKIPLDDNVQNAMSELDRDVLKGYDEEDTRTMKTLNLRGKGYSMYSNYGDGTKEMSGISKETALFEQRMAIWEFSAMQSNADKKWIIQRDYLNALIRQQQCQQWIAWLSPSEIFGQATDALCRTDMQNFLKFMESIRNYRETFIRYYTDKKLFESFAYFTGHTFESLYTKEEIENTKGGLWKLMGEKGISNQMFPYLNTDDVPRFISQPVTLATVLSGDIGRFNRFAWFDGCFIVGYDCGFYEIRC